MNRSKALNIILGVTIGAVMLFLLFLEAHLLVWFIENYQVVPRA